MARFVYHTSHQGVRQRRALGGGTAWDRLGPQGLGGAQLPHGQDTPVGPSDMATATGWATARSTGPGGSPVALLAWATRRGSRCPDCAVLARWGRQLPTRHGRRWATARGSSGATSRRSDLGEHGERGRDARPATAAAHQLSAILGDDGTARWATASRLSDQEASWPIGHGDGGTRDWPTLYGRTVPPRIDSGHGNVCTASRPPRGVGGTAGAEGQPAGIPVGCKS